MNSGCFGLSSAKHFLPLNARCNIYHSLILSHVNYGILAVSCAKLKDLNILQTIQKKAVRHVALAKSIAHTGPLLTQLDFLDFHDTVCLNRAIFVHKMLNDRLPRAFADYYQYVHQSGQDRNRNDDGKLFIPAFNHPKILSPKWECFKYWNYLPLSLRRVEKEGVFRSELKTLLQTKYKEECSIINCISCQ